MAAGVRPPLLDPYRPTWAEIDLDALTDNFAAVRRRVGRTPILAVVKADGYGHGAVEVARALEQAGAACFGVALPEEGVELRRAGVRVPILLLGGFALPQADLVLAHDLVPAVFRPDQVEALAAAAGSRGVRASVHLKIDTGMGRLGVPVEDVGSFAPILAGSPCLQVTGAFSHLAVADDPADPYTARQIALFKNALATLRTYGLNPSQVHLANSAAITDYESAWLTLVRPGIILFGYPPSEKVTSLPVRPVLSLKTCIIYIKEVPPGASLGYGRSFVATRPTRVASVPIGSTTAFPASWGIAATFWSAGTAPPSSAASAWT